MCVSIGVSDTLKYIALGLLKDIVFYKMEEEPFNSLFRMRTIFNPLKGRPVHNIIFLRQNDNWKIICYSYMHIHNTLSLNDCELDEVCNEDEEYGGDTSTENTGIQVICMSQTKFYILKDGNLSRQRKDLLH